MEEVIKKTINSIQIDPKHWVLPLSGGYDSRALLLFLKEKYNLETITWGTEASLTKKIVISKLQRNCLEKLVSKILILY